MNWCRVSGFEQLRRIFGEDGRTYEVVGPLRLGDQNFGTINIGVSTLLIRKDLEERFQPVLVTALWALLAAIAGALGLAQWLLRPIHVLRSGLRQLERGEPAAIELPQDEFGDLGREIKAVSDKLLAERAAPEGPQAGLDSIVEHLADAVGIFGPGGELLFANPTLRALLKASEPSEPFADIVDRTRESRASADPVTLALASGDADGSAREWHVMAHPVEDRDRRLVGVMVVARDLAALGEVESTLRYSRKLAALGRLTAGVAHEVKNPLNAMTIHLELLKGKLAPARARVGAGSDEPLPPTAGPERRARTRLGDRRRDSTSRSGGAGVPEVHAARGPEAAAGQRRRAAAGHRARGRTRCGQRQHPRRVRLSARPAVGPRRPRAAAAGAVQPGHQRVPGHAQRRHAPVVGAAGQRPPRRADRRGHRRRHPADASVAHLRPLLHDQVGGSGIGLSMVFRTIQLHDGEVEVQSTPGTGTTFRILLPQAASGPTVLGLR